MRLPPLRTGQLVQTSCGCVDGPDWVSQVTWLHSRLFRRNGCAPILWVPTQLTHWNKNNYLFTATSFSTSRATPAETRPQKLVCGLGKFGKPSPLTHPRQDMQRPMTQFTYQLFIKHLANSSIHGDVRWNYLQASSAGLCSTKKTSFIQSYRTSSVLLPLPRNVRTANWVSRRSTLQLPLYPGCTSRQKSIPMAASTMAG